ncbi:MAG: hypothetical protein WCW87_01455 [Candidatus Paceibacterota bacterium]
MNTVLLIVIAILIVILLTYYTITRPIKGSNRVKNLWDFFKQFKRISKISKKYNLTLVEHHDFLALALFFLLDEKGDALSQTFKESNEKSRSVFYYWIEKNYPTK